MLFHRPPSASVDDIATIRLAAVFTVTCRGAIFTRIIQMQEHEAAEACAHAS